MRTSMVPSTFVHPMLPSTFVPTQQESSLADWILSKAQPDNTTTTHLDAESAVDVFLQTKLSHQVLSKIWTESDIGAKGYLNRNEVTVALRLIGWAQSGEQILDRSLLDKVDSPLAVISGFEPQVPLKHTITPPLPPKPTHSTMRSSKSLAVEDLAHFKKLPLSPVPSASSPSSPTRPSISRTPITRADLQEWNVPHSFISHAHKLFDKSDESQKGYLDLDDALSLLHKAKLSVDQLSKVCHVMGIEQSGRFSKDNFVGALFLVYRSLAGLEVPESLPESFATAFAPQPEPDPFSMERFPSPEDVEDEVGGLYTQIQALQEALTTVGRENEDLRSSVQTLTRISRSQSVHHNRLSRNVDTSLSEITRLQVEVDDKANIIATLRSAAELSDTLSHDLSRENAVFRLQIEELTSLLEISNGDAAAQKLVAEELQRETERLRHQLEELRETFTRVPTGGGDEELQNLINEDLSRENRQLRSKTRELQEFIAQRQAPTYELNSLKESTRELTHENKRLQRRVRELESESASRDEARNRAEELDRENARLRRELEQTRRRPVRQNTTDVPPPAYEEIGRR